MKPISATLFHRLKSKMESETFKSLYRKRHSDFVRKRVLGFSDLLFLQLHRMSKSLSIELVKFFKLAQRPFCSKQAFSKARKKLKHEAFMELNRGYVLDYYGLQENLKKYLGTYSLVAVDGSLVQLPESEGVASFFGRWGNQTGQGMSMGRSSVVYDLLNGLNWSGGLFPLSQGETTVFALQYDWLKGTGIMDVREYLLFLFDRGYPGFDLFNNLEKDGHCFVARCRASFSRETRLFAESGKQEGAVTLYPTDYTTKKGEKRKSSTTQPIQLRIVHILLPSGQDEYLLTNTSLTREQLYEVYGLRWGVETYYGFLKEGLELENFSAKTVEGVLQDYHAALLLGNVASVLIDEAQQQLDEEQAKKDNKHQYKVNKNVALGLIRAPLMELLLGRIQNPETELEALRQILVKQKVAVVPNRKFPRHKQKRSRRKFHRNKISPL